MTDLRAFSDRYLVRDDGTEDGPWSQEIPGTAGVIYAHGHNGSLAVLVQSDSAARKLSALGLKVRQRGDTETVFLFGPGQLDEVAGIIQAVRQGAQ